MLRVTVALLLFFLLLLSDYTSCASHHHQLEKNEGNNQITAFRTLELYDKS